MEAAGPDICKSHAPPEQMWFVRPFFGEHSRPAAAAPLDDEPSVRHAARRAFPPALAEKLTPPAHLSGIELDMENDNVYG
ncbi:MAG: hypothetical protein ACK4NA_01775 [Alphaproteobacteria bacterium]